MSELSKEESKELSRLKKKLKHYEEKLKELERLKNVEQSIMVGLNEEGFSDKALNFFRYRIAHAKALFITIFEIAFAIVLGDVAFRMLTVLGIH